MRKARLAALAAVALLAIVVPAGDAAARAAASAEVVALAVSQGPDGLAGIHAQVRTEVLAGGSGQVYVATKPLAAQDMQGSARLASRVAARLVGADWDQQDYLVAFTSPSPAIGGPSAGAVMTLGFATALHNLANPGDPWELDPRVAATGTVNADGTIGPVGGIPAKAEAAAQAGIRTFLYPAGLDQAVTLERGARGVRQVAVDMQEHCGRLGIECRPVASVREVVALAAGVRLPDEAVEVPQTADYRAELAGLVAAQVEETRQLVEVAGQELPSATLGAADQRRLEQELARARSRLGEAEAALRNETYYLAATASFQGNIAARSVQMELEFRVSGRTRAAAEAAVASCEAEVARVGANDGAPPRTASEVWAEGAAAVRLAQARALGEQARGQLEGARSVAALTDALASSAYCIERARTVTFWAGLAQAFPGGPQVDARALGADAVEEAEELVLYAQAAMGAVISERAAEARALLEAGEPAAALVAAAEAGAEALVSLQAGGGASEIPTAVLDAARAGASRAVAQARRAGAEPMLSVSLIELASSQPPEQALASLWQARSLASLVILPAPSHEPEAAGSPGPRSPPGITTPSPAVLAVAAALLLAVRGRQRRG